jgi:hypothetical protein
MLQTLILTLAFACGEKEEEMDTATEETTEEVSEDTAEETEDTAVEE